MLGKSPKWASKRDRIPGVNLKNKSCTRCKILDSVPEHTERFLRRVPRRGLCQRLATMRFPPTFLDEIRARLSVSEVVGKRVKLKKAGREWKGLSPFQQEKTPSFFVNDQKQAWFDFSSGLNGNIFDFLMKTEGVGFPEAVERCAAMAGLALPAATPDAARFEQRRRTLHDIMELAAKYFQDTLASRLGAKARGYLADRAISPATQLQFRLGYATGERFALKEHLGAQ